LTAGSRRLLKEETNKHGIRSRNNKAATPAAYIIQHGLTPSTAVESLDKCHSGVDTKNAAELLSPG